MTDSTSKLIPYCPASFANALAANIVFIIGGALAQRARDCLKKNIDLTIQIETESSIKNLLSIKLLNR